MTTTHDILHRMADVLDMLQRSRYASDALCDAGDVLSVALGLDRNATWQATANALRTRAEAIAAPELPEALPGASAMTSERLRQIQKEGWSAEHDDKHTDGSLVEAAVMYARYGTAPRFALGHGIPSGWPWHPSWWNPSRDPLRNLEKAGALLMAEYDRLCRASKPGEVSPARVEPGLPEGWEWIEGSTTEAQSAAGDFGVHIVGDTVYIDGEAPAQAVRAVLARAGVAP